MMTIEPNVVRCMEKYNLSREEAERIITTTNSELSIEDLRYKYDNMELGKSFPEWITPENLLSMCYKAVGTICNSNYYWYYGPDEIALDLYIWAVIRLNKYDNFKVLKKALHDQCKTIIRDINRKEVINISSISMSNFEKPDEGDIALLSEVEDLRYEDKLSTSNLLLNIRNIKSSKIRGILILGGYFIANIIELADLVVDVYNTSSDLQKKKLYELCKDDKWLCDRLNLQYDNSEVCKISIGRILKIYGEQHNNFLNQELLPYLEGIGFLNV